MISVFYCIKIKSIARCKCAGTEGWEFTVEEGKLLRVKLNESTLAHSTLNKKINNSGEQSLFAVMSLIFISLNVCLFIYYIRKYLITNFNNNIDSVFISILIILCNLFIAYIFVHDSESFWANDTDGVSHG